MRKIILATVMAIPLFAQSTNYIEIGAGAQKIRDNFDVKSNEYDTSYGKSDRFSKTIPYIDFEFNYNNFIAKTIIDEILLGYKIDKFTVGLTTNVLMQKEVWKDPYALGINKGKTDLSKNGLYVAYSLVDNDNYASELSYAFTKHNIEDDYSISSLQRDAKNHQLKIENRYKTNILFNLAYDIYDAEGKASSYDKYEVGAGYIYEINNRFNVVFLGNIGQTSYDETNLVLNKEIKSTNTQLVVSGTWKNPFGFNDKYSNIKPNLRNI